MGWVQGWVLAAAFAAAPAADAGEAADARREAAEAAYFEALATQLASSIRPRDLLLAAQLIRHRASRAERSGDGVLAQRYEANADGMLQRALTLDPDDPVLWWSARAPCQRGPACGGVEPVRRLRTLEPSNGTVWMLRLAIADQDAALLDAELRLARMASASRFDSHLGDTVRLWLDVFERYPLPEAVLRDFPGWEQPLSRERGAAVLASGLALAQAMPEFSGYGELCGEDALVAGGEKRAELCRPALDRALQKADALVTWYGAFGPRLLLETDPARREELQRRRDALEWQTAAVDELYEQLRSPRGWRAYDDATALWRRPGASELQVNRDLLQAHGIALTPPPGWRSWRAIGAPAATPER